MEVTKLLESLYFFFLCFTIQETTAQLGLPLNLRNPKEISQVEPETHLEMERFASKLASHPRFIYEKQMKTLAEFPMQNVSATCQRDLFRIISDLEDSAEYALKMVDSIGKPGAGILDSNWHWFGSFEQCKSVLVPENGTRATFSPQYCIPTMLSLFLVGVCVPDSCSENDLQILINDFFNGDVIDHVHCVHPVPWRGGDTAMVVLFVAFAILVASSTGYDFYKRSKQKRSASKADGIGHTNKAMEVVDESTHDIQLNGIKTTSPDNINIENGGVSLHNSEIYKANGSTSGGLHGLKTEATSRDTKPSRKEEVFKSFSLLSNIPKLLVTNSTPKGMECLNGIRVISISWVILGHTYVVFAFYCSNALRLLSTYPTRLSFQFMWEAELSMDTFFFLSGFLVAYGTLKILHKNKGKLNWAFFYIHRYLRLTPIYMFCLLFWATLTAHLVTGPYESEKMMDVLGISVCKEIWWRNLLYINNFFGESCFAWSWYLANDMQFYVVSPIFVYALYRNRKVGYAVVLAGILSNLMAIGIICNKYGLYDPNSTVDPEIQEKYKSLIGNRPYYRIAPYLVGIACADIYMNTKDRARNMRTKSWKIFVVVMWILSIGMNWTLLYGYYPYNKDRSLLSPVWLNELYQSTHKFVWSLTCAWISYACLTGWGGFINRLLSLKIWEPLVRLCYIAYLIHLIIMSVHTFNLQQTIIVNDWIYAFHFVAYLIVTFTIAPVLFLLVEQPLGRLQRTFLKK